MFVVKQRTLFTHEVLCKEHERVRSLKDAQIVSSTYVQVTKIRNLTCTGAM